MIAAVVTMLRLQLLRVYQSEDTVLADLLTEIAQVRGDLAIAVDRAALQLGLLDHQADDGHLPLAATEAGLARRSTRCAAPA